VKKTYLFGVCWVLIVISIIFAGGTLKSSFESNVIGNGKSGSEGSDSTLKKDSVPVVEQPQVFMTVSPRILIGCWKGNDSLGQKVSFSFSDPLQGEPAVFHVNIRIGKRSVSGVCSYWENNMCNLMLGTNDLQNIVSRWFFKFDGTLMTIQLGDDQRVAGTNVFKLKKDEKR
jgi:hypothetical protein